MPQLILVKLEESVTLDNPHDSNAQPPTVVTLSGISILVKLLHPKNARKLICCTLFGILTFCKLLQPANASLPITVIPSSILTCRTDNSSQGAEPPFPKFSISPVPEIVSTPFSSSVHVTFSPQVPLSTMLFLLSVLSDISLGALDVSDTSLDTVDFSGVSLGAVDASGASLGAVDVSDTSLGAVDVSGASLGAVETSSAKVGTASAENRKHRHSKSTPVRNPFFFLTFIHLSYRHILAPL